MSTRARKEREKLERRNTIISAAKELFWEKGYEATMDEIAGRAELSKPTLYLYFQNKDDLYASIVLDGFQELKEKLKAVEAEKGVEQKFKSFYRTFVDFSMEHKEHFRIVQFILTQNARKNISGELSRKINKDGAELIGYWIEIIRQAQEAKVIKEDVDPTTLAIITWRMATGILELPIEGGLVGYRPYNELLDSAIELLFYGARA